MRAKCFWQLLQANCTNSWHSQRPADSAELIHLTHFGRLLWFLSSSLVMCCWITHLLALSRATRENHLQQLCREMKSNLCPHRQVRLLNSVDKLYLREPRGPKLFVACPVNMLGWMSVVTSSIRPLGHWLNMIPCWGELESPFALV